MTDLLFVVDSSLDMFAADPDGYRFSGGAGSLAGIRQRFSSLPQMHLSGVGRLTNNWRIALDADGLWTARGRSLDLGLNIDYSLNRSMQLFGGYRLTDFTGDAEDFYGSGTTNTANVGLRVRF